MVSAQRLQGWAGLLLPGLQSTFLPRSSSTHDFVELCFQGTLSSAVPLYIFGASSGVAGLLAALCLTESLGSALPNTFEVVANVIIFVIAHSRI